MKRYIIATLFVCAVSNSLFAQEQCPGESLTISNSAKVPASWTDCVGKFTIGGDFKESNGHVGETYVGEFKNGKMHGQGTYINYTISSGWYSDGTYIADGWVGGTYIGEFKEGKKHGQGTMTYEDDSVEMDMKYIGEWREDERHGKGTLTYRTNFGRVGKYVGEYKEGLKWNGLLIETDGEGWEYQSKITNGITKDYNKVPSKKLEAKWEEQKKAELEKEKRLQEKAKSANVDKNKCYTLFTHAHSKFIYDGDFSLRPTIEKIEILKPSIDVQTQNYLIANYSNLYLLEDYTTNDGKYHHIWVACINLTESVEVANPFE